MFVRKQIRSKPQVLESYRLEQDSSNAHSSTVRQGLALHLSKVSNLLAGRKRELFVASPIHPPQARLRRVPLHQIKSVVHHLTFALKSQKRRARSLHNIVLEAFSGYPYKLRVAQKGSVLTERRSS